MPRRFGFNPDWVIHPGATLKEWREDIHLPSRAAAVACGLTYEQYDRIESGEEPITEDIAQRLDRGTGIPTRLWLNLERIFRAGLAAGKTWTP